MRAISCAEARLTPATLDDIRHAAGRVIDMATTFRIECDPARVGSVYRQMLENMPPDLLDSGVDLVLTMQTDTFRMPMPGAIWKAVEGEYNRRKAAVDRLKTAKIIGDRRGWEVEPPPGAYVEKKSLDDVVGGALKTLHAATQEFQKRKRRT